MLDLGALNTTQVECVRGKIQCTALKCTTILMEVCDLAALANMKPYTQELGVGPEPNDRGV